MGEGGLTTGYTGGGCASPVSRRSLAGHCRRVGAATPPTASPHSDAHYRLARVSVKQAAHASAFVGRIPHIGGFLRHTAPGTVGRSTPAGHDGVWIAALLDGRMISSARRGVRSN